MTLVQIPVDPMVYLQVNHGVNLVYHGLNLKLDRMCLPLLNAPHGININNDFAHCIVAVQNRSHYALDR